MMMLSRFSAKEQQQKSRHHNSSSAEEEAFPLLAPNISCALEAFGSSEWGFEEVRMRLENELNSLREQQNSLWPEREAPRDWLHFYKKLRAGNWAKCRLCGQKISRAARQSNLILAAHLKNAHPEHLELQESVEALRKALAQIDNEELVSRQ